MKFLKSKRARVTVISVVSVLTAFIIAVNILASLPYFFNLISSFLGRKTPVYADGVVSMFPALETTSKQEAFKFADDVNNEICEEGFVLLKNKNGALPLKKNAGISVFGKNSVNLSYGGSGSSGGFKEKYVTLYESLSEKFSVNPVLKAFYENNKQSGAPRSSNPGDLDSGKPVEITVGETPQSMYTSAVKDSYSKYNDAAVVVVTRIGGEGFDFPRYQGQTEGAVSADSHYLELDKNERDLLTAVCNAGFEKVVVLFNTPAAFQADFLEDTASLDCADKIDAAMFVGFTGYGGAKAIGKVLCGEANPSGRTADTWAKNFKADPSFENFANGSTDKTTDKYDFDKYYFVDYEESIYVGYRYWETRGFTDGEEWYNNSVVYPFGHGLSYTDFEWAVKDVGDTQITVNGTVSVTVTVKNTGNAAGKDVVQLYCRPPYTAGGIEKPYKVLAGFAKTDIISPGKSQDVIITFNPYDVASYDYKDANNNGFYGYELEAGLYTLHIAKNAHNTVDTVELSLAQGIRYDKDPVTKNTVGNRFTADGAVTATDLTHVYDSGWQLDTLLSRTDWAGTWPTPPTDEQHRAGAELQSQLKSVATNNPVNYDDEEYPLFEEKTDMVLRDMLPADTPETSYKAVVDYDDGRWETFIDACKEKDLKNLHDYGVFNTLAIQDIGLPATRNSDGPAGWTCFMDSEIYGYNYCSEPIMASTWNTQLIEKLGVALGEEGVWGNEQTGQPYSSIYAPGVNIHRNPFGGRSAEYFSEDPFISGKMAAAEIRGAQSRGVICTIKHFAVNEQETHRAINGDVSWVDEQALREIYLKAFEIAIKDSECRGLMTSFNRIGTKWTGGDYRLCTEILRDEWGFRGYVICDFATGAAYMNSRQMAYAGGDINLRNPAVSWYSSGDTGDAIILRQCAKNLMYAVVNSNAMNGDVIGYRQPIWYIMMFVVDAIVLVCIAAWVFFAVYTARKENVKCVSEQKENTDFTE